MRGTVSESDNIMKTFQGATSSDCFPCLAPSLENVLNKCIRAEGNCLKLMLMLHMWQKHSLRLSNQTKPERTWIKALFDKEFSNYMGAKAK